MTTETAGTKDMGVMGRIVGIFSSPREAFESIEQKPTWVVPFIIGLIVFFVFQFFTLDIQVQDRIAMMEARGMTGEQLAMVRSQMEGPAKYAGFIVGPIFMLIVWAILSGIYMFVGNTVMGGESSFKKVFSVIAWSSLIGTVSLLLRTFLVVSKGTNQGVVTSPAILLPTPGMAEGPNALYRLLNQFDLFTIWSMFVTIIGFSVIFKFTMKKSATFIIALWIIYVILAVALGGLFSGMFGG